MPFRRPRQEGAGADVPARRRDSGTTMWEPSTSCWRCSNWKTAAACSPASASPRTPPNRPSSRRWTQLPPPATKSPESLDSAAPRRPRAYRRDQHRVKRTPRLPHFTHRTRSFAAIRAWIESRPDRRSVAGRGRRLRVSANAIGRSNQALGPCTTKASRRTNPKPQVTALPSSVETVQRRLAQPEFAQLGGRVG